MIARYANLRVCAMEAIKKWIDDKLLETENRLPSVKHNDPVTFSIGYNYGYKLALLDLKKFIKESINE